MSGLKHPGNGAAFALLAGAAGAYNFRAAALQLGGESGRHPRYHSKLKARAWAVDHAIAAWMHSGIDLHFKSVGKRHADVLIRPDSSGGCGTGYTQLTVDNQTRRPIGTVVVRIGVGDQGGPLSILLPHECQFTDTLVVAHELGHANDQPPERPLRGDEPAQHIVPHAGARSPEWGLARGLPARGPDPLVLPHPRQGRFARGQEALRRKPAAAQAGVLPDLGLTRP